MNDRFKFRIWEIKEKRYNKYPPYGYQGGTFNMFSTDESLIEQCTGLKDKNGELIYEGDILKCVHSDIMQYKIYWGRSCWRMKVYGTDNKIVDDTHLFLDTTILEVIGNIHENEDLLENEE